METKAISLTVWSGQAELLRRAAERNGVSVSEFIRASAVPAAAMTLGEALPDFPAFEQPHFRRSVVTRAAEALGITPDQFRRGVLERAAALVVSDLDSGASGTRRVG